MTVTVVRDGSVGDVHAQLPEPDPAVGVGRGTVTRAVEAYSFSRLYDNFGGTIDTDARAVVRRSADRYVGWIRGDFDHLT
jgi:hypothetical protein